MPTVLSDNGASWHNQPSLTHPPTHAQVCDPLTPGCRLGPVVSEGQYRKILGYIEVGCCRSCEVLQLGGHRSMLPSRSDTIAVG